MKMTQLSIIASGLFMLSAATVQAQDKVAPAKDAHAQKDMQARMTKAKAAGKPSAHHAVLKALAGDWTVKNTVWMHPGAKPQVSTGTSSIAWTLGGRFLRQDFKGSWGTETFEGLGYLGYDNVKKAYVSIWMDNMSTGIVEGSGTYDGATKTFRDSGTYSCPFSGEKEKWYRAEWKIVGKNALTYTMYTKDPSGKEFKSMEIRYKRST
ncbi:MAG: DUF1579 domain-containing protein [Myxococcales bacterium]|nr:DUF1579 domain-containing protein [Myxococcales bacterium]